MRGYIVNKTIEELRADYQGSTALDRAIKRSELMNQIVSVERNIAANELYNTLLKDEERDLTGNTPVSFNNRNAFSETITITNALAMRRGYIEKSEEELERLFQIEFSSRENISDIFLRFVEWLALSIADLNKRKRIVFERILFIYIGRFFNLLSFEDIAYDLREGKSLKYYEERIEELANDDEFLNDFNARSQLAFATKLIAIHNLSRGNEDNFKYYMMVSSTIEAENNTEDLMSKLIVNDFILTPNPAE